MEDINTIKIYRNLNDVNRLHFTNSLMSNLYDFNEDWEYVGTLAKLCEKIIETINSGHNVYKMY